MQAIACHHDWNAATEARELVMVVAFADLLSECLGPDFAPEETKKADPHVHPVLRPLHLTVRDVDDMLARKRLFESLLGTTEV
jgi:hypothetical protein